MKECNIGGGAATFKSSQDGGLPGFSSTTSEEKWISGRWSPGGLEVKRRRSFNFQAGGSIFSCWSLCLVGCFSPSVVTSPYLWPGARRFLTSCKKAKVTQSWRQSRIFDFHTKLHESESLLNSSIFVLYM